MSYNKLKQLEQKYKELGEEIARLKAKELEPFDYSKFPRYHVSRVGFYWEDTLQPISSGSFYAATHTGATHFSKLLYFLQIVQRLADGLGATLTNPASSEISYGLSFSTRRQQWEVLSSGSMQNGRLAYRDKAAVQKMADYMNQHYPRGFEDL